MVNFDGINIVLQVGSFARGLFLVHSECLESNYIASRPFRVNAVSYFSNSEYDILKTFIWNDMLENAVTYPCSAKGFSSPYVVAEASLTPTHPGIRICNQ